ncbi:MAG: hypothetical protein HOE90_15190 [Bacteriovoracaceae bacterium]|jgi:D-glycero-alpha-D-manno-heptose-7-phosphate kinase|nr:hypothetical protein [Bacteriovoracaceae bacterium]
MEFETKGSVRVDLLGGTLDLAPINLILDGAYTLNVATSLKANVLLRTTDFDGIEINSIDYNSVVKFESAKFTKENLSSGEFKELRFVAEIFHYFGTTSGVYAEMKSGSPPGAGLGGSSTMGVTLFKALCKFNGISFSRVEAIKVVSGIERMILMKGQTGYQDYYPALYGGILCLKPHPLAPEVAQLYTPELASYLCEHLTLVSSGKSRLSGINNWEVYKSFFDGDERVQKGLAKIARLASRGYQAISDGQYSKLKELIIAEGVEREQLWPGIVIDEVVAFRDQLTQIDSGSGIKICGAGGGGCFLAIHSKEAKADVQHLISECRMSELAFQIDPPLT